MIDFEPTEEQKALIETARRFASERIIPIAAECDRDAKFPREVFVEAHALGLVNPHAPQRVRRRRPERRRLELHHRGARVRLLRHPDEHDLQHAGDDAHQARRLRGAEEEVPRLARGASRSSCRYATTEPGAGSDVAGLQCRATKDSGGGYVLNGTKQWITNATMASFYVIFATEDPRAEAQGHRRLHRRARSQTGVKPGRHEDKLGQRASDTAQVVLEDVRVPAEQVLAPPGQGFKLAMETFNQTRPDIGAIAVGLMRRCLDESVAYARGAQDLRRRPSPSTSSSRR